MDPTMMGKYHDKVLTVRRERQGEIWRMPTIEVGMQ